MIEELRKDLIDLRDLMSQDGEQQIAPCLGGIAHSETRDLGPKSQFREGPEWMWRGEPQSCKDTYRISEVVLDEEFDQSIKVFECVERCVMSTSRPTHRAPYLNQASLEHLLEIFAHEYLNKSL
jgi:hypothetical protein